MAKKRAKKALNKAQKKKAALKNKVLRTIKGLKLGAKKAEKKHRLAMARTKKALKGLEKRLAALRA